MGIVVSFQALYNKSASETLFDYRRERKHDNVYSKRGANEPKFYKLEYSTVKIALLSLDR
jgi:hypothetical protein